MGIFINPFYAQILTCPIPMEMSFSPCTNRCSYCFACLNKYDVKFDIQKFNNWLMKKLNKENDLIADMLRQKYMVAMCNRTDPFCDGNYDTTMKVLEIFDKLDIRYGLQTKGHKRLLKDIDNMPNTWWYISLTTNNAEIHKKYESKAPDYQTRLAIIEKLIKRGSQVQVAINPYVPEWIPDPEGLIADLKSVGAKYIFINGLHFDSNQLRILKLLTPEWENLRDFSFRSRSSLMDAREMQCIEFHKLLQSNGFETDIVNPKTYGHCNDSIMNLNNGTKMFPINELIVQRLFKTAEKNNWDEIIFDKKAFIDFMLPYFPDGQYDLSQAIFIKHYVYDYKYWRIKKPMSFRELLSIIWDNEKDSSNPVKCDYIYDNSDLDETEKYDENGCPNKLFDKKGSNIIP